MQSLLIDVMGRIAGVTLLVLGAVVQISFAVATVAISIILGISLIVGHDAPLPRLIPS